MMAAFIDDSYAQSNAQTTSLNQSWDGAGPGDGDLIIVVSGLSPRKNTELISGFTQLTSFDDTLVGNFSAATQDIWGNAQWKKAGASEPTSIAVTMSGAIKLGVALLAFSGMDTTDPLDTVEKHSEDNTASNAVSITLSGPISQADSVAVVLAGIQHANSGFPTGATLSDGFTLAGWGTSSGSGSDPSYVVGYKVLSSTVAPSCTATFTGATNKPRGIAMLIFKGAAAAGIFSSAILSGGGEISTAAKKQSPGLAALAGSGAVALSAVKGGLSAFETGGGGRLNLLPLKNTDQVAVLQSGGVIQTSASRSVSLGAFIGGGGIMVASVAGEVHFSAVFLEGAGGLITGARKSANDNAHVGIGGSATAAASKRRPEWSLISGGGAIGTSFSASRMAAIVASAGGYTVVAPTPARLGSVLVVGGGGAAAVAVQVLFNDLMATITITGEIGISVAVSGKIDANTPLTGSQDPVQEFDAILKA